MQTLQTQRIGREVLMGSKAEGKKSRRVRCFLRDNIKHIKASSPNVKEKAGSVARH